MSRDLEAEAGEHADADHVGDGDGRRRSRGHRAQLTSGLSAEGASSVLAIAIGEPRDDGVRASREASEAVSASTTRASDLS